MRRTSIMLCTALAVILSGVISPALAGDKEDLKARIVKYHQVWNAKDVDAFVTYFSSEGLTLAGGGGGFFGDPATFLNILDPAALKQTWQNPKLQPNLTPRYIHVSIYGNGAVGVANYYRLGTQTNAAGETRQVRLRVTDVWVKEKGEWRAAHRHLSPLRIGLNH